MQFNDSYLATDIYIYIYIYIHTRYIYIYVMYVTFTYRKLKILQENVPQEWGEVAVSECPLRVYECRSPSWTMLPLLLLLEFRGERRRRECAAGKRAAGMWGWLLTVCWQQVAQLACGEEIQLMKTSSSAGAGFLALK